MSRTIVYGLVALAALSPSATACPYCESDIGRQVWAGIFNDDFALHAFLTLLPMPILGLLVATIHYWPEGPANDPRDDAQGEARS